MTRTLKCLLVAAGLSLGVIPSANAQITLTAPSGPQPQLTEGDDFFSTVMNEPLDFDQRRDFMWEEGFNEPTVSAGGGVWTGTSQTQGAHVFPLFPGFASLTNSGRFGDRFPIDTAKYKYLSVKRTVSSRSVQAIYVGSKTDWPVSSLCAGADGYYMNNAFKAFAANTWTVDLYDFRQSSTARCDAGNYNPSLWTGEIRGIRLDPSTGGPAGTTISYDWVRLVDPTSAPLITISWTTAPDPSRAVNVYVDNNNSGHDGTFIGRVRTDQGSSFVFPSAALPPGTWYFYLELRDNTTSDAAIPSPSNYSAGVTINGRTRLTVDAPSMTSGPDYATELLGNPWDFNDAADVANLNMTPEVIFKQFKNASIAGGQFTATAWAPVAPATESDVQVWLNTGNRPIPTWRYRYLSYTTSIDGTHYGNISNKVANGWIMRQMWWTTTLPNDGSETNADITYEGTHTYTVDLADPKTVNHSVPYASQKGWRGLSNVKYFRLDPGEFTQYETNFTLDDVKLRARPEPDSSNVFTVQVTTQDPEGNPATIQVYRDTDATGFDGTLVGTLSGKAPGTWTLPISTAGVFPRDYWIYVKVTDSANNVTRRYGDAPMHVGPQVWHSWFAVDPLETPYVGDFNGDGKSDIITFTRQNPAAVGDVYVALSDGSKFGDNVKWHDWFAINTSEQVVIGDYNADGKDDIATWLSASTRQVYVALSQGSGMGQETVWVNSIGTSATDVLMSGDANADNKDDLILFARSQGKVYVALSDGAKFGAPTVWHDFFAVSTYERPRVADVNGDNRADIVTFATDSPTAFGDVYVSVSDGNKYVDINGVPSSSTKWHDWFAIQPTEEVRIGDLDGDGSDDFFTFLPAPFGQAYTVRSLGSSMGDNVLWMPEGLVYANTDRPFVGDVNGDGKADVILFRQIPGRVEVVVTP